MLIVKLMEIKEIVFFLKIIINVYECVYNVFIKMLYICMKYKI